MSRTPKILRNSRIRSTKEWEMGMSCPRVFLSATMMMTLSGAIMLSPPTLVVCCAKDNDLFQVLVHHQQHEPGFTIYQFDNCTDAVANASLPTGGSRGVMLLADTPSMTRPITHVVLEALARIKGLKVFAELATTDLIRSLGWLDVAPCPSFARIVALPGSPLWHDQNSTNKSLRPLDLLEVGACNYLPWVTFLMQYTATFLQTKRSGLSWWVL